MTKKLTPKEVRRLTLIANADFTKAFKSDGVTPRRVQDIPPTLQPAIANYEMTGFGRKAKVVGLKFHDRVDANRKLFAHATAKVTR